MKFLRYFILSAVALCAISLVSCKKDDDDATTKKYLNGTLTFEFPKYVRYGDVVHVVPKGGYKEDESDTLFLCYWTNPLTGINDTVRFEEDPASKSREFDFMVTVDSLSSFTLTVTIVADGYYTKSGTAGFTIVNPTLGGGSLKGYDFLSSASTFTDSRDNREYYYNTVGGKDWMIQNLAWEGSGVAFENDEAISDVFGRFYTWTEAASACPTGWHLPSNAEFKALAEAVAGKEESAAGALMVNATFNGDKLWEFWPEVKITNQSRFSAIPLGYAVIEGESSVFRSYKEYAMFWTADASGSDMGIARYIYVDKPAFFSGEYGKESLRANVRCVR